MEIFQFFSGAEPEGPEIYEKKSMSFFSYHFHSFIDRVIIENFLKFLRDGTEFKLLKGFLGTDSKCFKRNFERCDFKKWTLDFDSKSFAFIIAFIDHFSFVNVGEYECTGNHRDVHEARLSFFSGHSAISVYTAFYVIVGCFSVI